MVGPNFYETLYRHEIKNLVRQVANIFHEMTLCIHIIRIITLFISQRKGLWDQRCLLLTNFQKI